MQTAEIRRNFLNFFSQKAHAIKPSSSLVPGKDPTLLFTNAGMVQFKDVFVGREPAGAHTRVVTAQRCLRAGGKHNDLENVGYTARHHTFFEMLGNFSFGDYFKEDAIILAWQFLTETLGLNPDKLLTTVYHEDDEGYDIWHKQIGLPASRCLRIGDKPGGPRYQSDNFWQMADVGPCGPSSEIFYDHGPSIPGGPPGSANEDGDRYIEIWNLVFMQFERNADGVLIPLPKPSIDTGMGLERLAAILQGVHNNYDIDLFHQLITQINQYVRIDDHQHPSLRVIADHIRACSFLIADGVLPSNEGRGYVLRRILRRAVRHAYKLGHKALLLHKLVDNVAELMADAADTLTHQIDYVQHVIKSEEERFSYTIEHGLKYLEEALRHHPEQLPGAKAFYLYDTHGFPLDLTADICRERSIRVDQDGFTQALNAQQQRARRHNRFIDHQQIDYRGTPSTFVGYHQLDCQAVILALYQDGQAVNAVQAPGHVQIICDQTPFYAESGGQVGDQGTLTSADGVVCILDDTQALANDSHVHFGQVDTGQLVVGQSVTLQVDPERRQKTVNNHSATHLLHSALRTVLGNHVAQRGSLVDDQRTRFDFAHPDPLSHQQITEIEQFVNEAIAANVSVYTDHKPIAVARAQGALALFDEKYGETVRVIAMGPHSTELCKGTHVTRTGDIGLFKIYSESSIASGVRRIEATTGNSALAQIQQQEYDYLQLLAALKTSPEQAMKKVEKLVNAVKHAEREIAKLNQQHMTLQAQTTGAEPIKIAGVDVILQNVDFIDRKALRQLVDQYKNELANVVVVVIGTDGSELCIFVGVSDHLVSKINSNDLIQLVCQIVEGRGGGRPNFAQGGGKNPAKINEAFDQARHYIQQNLSE